MKEKKKVYQRNSQQLNAASVKQNLVSKLKAILLVSILITFFIGTAIFGFGGFYLGKKVSFPPNTQIEANKIKGQIAQATPTPVLKTINSQTLRDIIGLFEDVTFEVVDHQTMWWVSNDNWSILVNNSEGLGLVSAKAYSELHDPTSVNSEIIENITSYLITQGYKQSQRNSSQSVSDDTFYDYIKGFENNHEKCLLSVNPDESYYQDDNKQMVASPNIIISCSTTNSFDASYKKQIPYLKAMNDRKAVISIQIETETAAKARIHWRRTGAFALFSKNNKFWEMIYLGQDQPSCKVLEIHNFPKEIHDSCH